MPRFTVTRAGRRIEIAFDDGGVNVLSSEALTELRGIVLQFIPTPSAARRRDQGSSGNNAETGSSLQPAPLIPRFARDKLIIFRSAHSHIFAAGADMAEMAEFTPLQAAEFARLGQETFRTIERLPMLTVALIDGDCFGGALDLVLSFDFRFATPRSRFSHPGGKLGIVTGFGGTSRWRKVLGAPAARSLFLGNPVLSAAEAAEAGLVDRVAEDFEPELQRLENVDPGTAQFVKELTIRADALTRTQLLLVAERLGHIYFEC